MESNNFLRTKNDSYTNYMAINKRLGITRYLSFKEFSKINIDVSQINPIEFFEELSDELFDKYEERDKYILENEERKMKYSKDSIFMQTYAILGKYTFENKRDFLEKFLKIYNALVNGEIELIEDIIVELTIAEQERNDSVNYAFDENGTQIADIFNTVFSNEVVQNSLSAVVNNSATAYEISEYSFTGEKCVMNYYRMQEMISDIANYIILHKSSNGIEKYVKKLEKIYNSDIPEEDKKIKIKEATVISIAQRLGIKTEELNSTESKKKIFEYMYEEFINKGYVFGNNDYSSINVELISDGDIETQKGNVDITHKINSLFSEQGLRKICVEKENDFFRFYNDEEEIIEIPTTILFQGLGNAYKSNNVNNELLRTMSSTNPNIIGNEFDRLAYDKHNLENCLSNLKNLCRKAELSDEDESLIISYFMAQWNATIDENYNEVNIQVVERSSIGENTIKDIDKYRRKIDTLSLEDIYTIIIGENLKEKERLLPVSKEKTFQIRLPKLDKMCGDITIEPDKYIMTSSGKKIRPDIIVNADSYDIDVLCITDVENNQIAIDKTGLGTHLDLILVPEDTDINASPVNGSVAFQSNAMMVAVNGYPISESGKKLIGRFRDSYDLDYIAQFYLAMSSVLLNITDDNEHFTKNKRTKLADRAISDLIPKAIYMLKYKKYPEGIKFSEDYEEYDNKLYRQLSVMRKNDDLYEEKFSKITSYAKEKISEYIDYPIAMEILEKELDALGTYDGFKKKFGIDLKSFFQSKTIDTRKIN